MLSDHKNIKSCATDIWLYPEKERQKAIIARGIENTTTNRLILS